MNRRGRRSGCRGLIRRIADVAGRVVRGDEVVIGAGGDLVGVCRARHLADQGRWRRRESAGGGAIDIVAGNPDVVRGGGPGEADAADGSRGCEVGRRTWRLGVGERDSGSLVRRVADVAGGVVGGHEVVIGAGGDLVSVCRARHLADQGRWRRRESAGGGAIDIVAGNPDVVGRGGPGEADGANRARGREVGWGTRWLGIRRGGSAGRLVRRVADVAGGVVGGHEVVIGAGGDLVGVCRARHGAEKGRWRRRESTDGGAIDIVAGNPDVVGGGGPGEADAAEGPRGGEVGRSTRRLGVGERGAGRLVRRVADVAGGVVGGHEIVIGAGGDLVGVSRARHLAEEG